MTDLNIINLVTLLQGTNVSKEELRDAIEKIHFISYSARDTEFESQSFITKNNQSSNKDHEQSLSEEYFNGAKEKIESISSNPDSNEISCIPNDNSMKDMKIQIDLNVLKNKQVQSLREKLIGKKNYKNLNLKYDESKIGIRKQQQHSFKSQIGCQTPKIQIESLINRLYSQNKSKRIIDQLCMEKNLKDEEEFKKNCTFKPKIKSTDTSPRYMETTQDNILNGYIRSQMKEVDLQYSFSPKVIPSVNNAAKSNELSKIKELRTAYQQKRKQGKIKTCNDESLFKIQNVVIEKRKLNEFYTRQHNFELKKQETIQKKINDYYANKQPEINKKSKEIIKKHSKINNKSSISKKKCQEDLKTKEINYSFQPAILSISSQRQPQTSSEMCYGPGSKKKQKIALIKKELMKNVSKDYTFAPEFEVGLYIAADSKLQLKHGINTYSKRIKSDDTIKENIFKLNKYLKETKKMNECTYSPMINSYSSHVPTIKNKDNTQKSISSAL